jgi:hypothetical protein
MATGKHDIVLPAEFSGQGQFILYTRYGDPRNTGWENKWITNWDIQKDYPWFPAKGIQIHKHFWPVLDAAFRELEGLGLHEEIKTYACCYEVRTVRGSDTVVSVHSWGAAIDLNIEENPLGGEGAWSDEFLEVMERNNIFCGQNWEGRKEPMHFAMVNG